MVWWWLRLIKFLPLGLFALAPDLVGILQFFLYWLSPFASLLSSFVDVPAPICVTVMPYGMVSKTWTASLTAHRR